jgi:azurin
VKAAELEKSQKTVAHLIERAPLHLAPKRIMKKTIPLLCLMAWQTLSFAEEAPQPAAPAPAATTAVPEPVIDPNTAVLELKPHPEKPLAFATENFTVKAGQKVRLTLMNSGGLVKQPHNVLVLKPGKEQAVGNQANTMITDPQAMTKNYIPEAAKEDIIAHTKILQDGQSETIEFTLPNTAGEYPFICTFPGHWMLMKGKITATP